MKSEDSVLKFLFVQLGLVAPTTVSLLNELSKRDRQICSEVFATFCQGFCKQFLSTEIKQNSSLIETLKRTRIDKDANSTTNK